MLASLGVLWLSRPGQGRKNTLGCSHWQCGRSTRTGKRCFFVPLRVYATAIETKRLFFLFGVVRTSPRLQSRREFVFRNVSTPPRASTAFCKKWPCVGVSTSVVDSPFSPLGARKRIVRGASRQVVEAKRRQTYSPGSRPIALVVFLGFGAVVSWSLALFSASCCSVSAVWCSWALFARSCKIGRRFASGAATTRIGFHAISQSFFLEWKTLAGSISISSPAFLVGPRGGSQYVVLLNLSWLLSKRSAQLSRTFSSPLVAQTAFGPCPTARKTTRDLFLLPSESSCPRSRRKPKTLYRRPTISATFSVLLVPRASSTMFFVFADLSEYLRKAWAMWANLSSSFARCCFCSSWRLCSSSSQTCAFRFQTSWFSASRISWRRFSRFLVERVDMARASAISGTSCRRKIEISLPKVWHFFCRHTHETVADGGKRVAGSGAFGCSWVGCLLAAKTVFESASLV